MVRNPPGNSWCRVNRDADAAVPLIEATRKRFPELFDPSFDRGISWSARPGRPRRHPETQCHGREGTPVGLQQYNRGGTPGGNHSGDTFLARSTANRGPIPQLGILQHTFAMIADEAFDTFYPIGVDFIA